MNEREATQLLERLGGMLDVSGAPVERVVDAGKRASRRRRRWQVGGAAAAVAVVAIGAGVIAQNTPVGDTAPPISRTSSPTTTDGGDALVTPPGTRLVGANGVVVAVPASFTTNDTPCGAPNSDTVTLDDDGPWPACSTQDLNATLVDIVDTESSQWASRLHADGTTVTVQGLRGVRTKVLCSVAPPLPPICSGTLTFPVAGVSFRVRSERFAEINRILDSAQAVPDAYATVPDVSAMLSNDATSAIEAVGLTVDPPCELPDCSMSVIGTDPPAGTPVTTGSGVSLVPDGRYPGRAPSASDLLGSWRLSQIGVEHFSRVQRSFGEPVLLTFDPLYPWLGWRGYDGCNWSSGRVHLDVTGSFSTSQNSTTTRGCIGIQYRHPTIPEIVEGASIVTFGHHHLRFYDSDTRLLATFVRARSGLG
jgi:PASTA domain